MEHTRLLRLAPSRALKEKRLAALLEEAGERGPALRDAVEEEQVAGSLGLAGLAATVDDVRAARRGEPAPPHVSALLVASRAVDAGAPFSVGALSAWHAALGEGAGFRTGEGSRPGGPPPAPAEFVASRLEVLADWLQAESSRELGPAQAGALVLARIVEVLPFDDGNGRVARLAASHLMVRGGARPPLLADGDEARLRQALQSAFQLQTEPLATLLDEASERSLDVMIRTLEVART